MLSVENLFYIICKIMFKKIKFTLQLRGNTFIIPGMLFWNYLGGFSWADIKLRVFHTFTLSTQEKNHPRQELWREFWHELDRETFKFLPKALFS